MTFEEAFARLEEITRTLEAGDVSLEDSLKLFEEGTGLSRWCAQQLEEARQKVEILLKGPDGELKIEPFQHS